MHGFFDAECEWHKAYIHWTPSIIFIFPTTPCRFRMLIHLFLILWDESAEENAKRTQSLKIDNGRAQLVHFLWHLYPSPTASELPRSCTNPNCFAGAFETTTFGTDSCSTDTCPLYQRPERGIFSENCDSDYGWEGCEFCLPSQFKSADAKT